MNIDERKEREYFEFNRCILIIFREDAHVQQEENNFILYEATVRFNVQFISLSLLGHLIIIESMDLC